MEDLIVYHKGEPVLTLNARLIKQQKCGESEVEAIKSLHEVRLQVEDIMRSFDDPEILKHCDKICTTVEFALQGAWGFPKDAKWHRFWERPRCACPKMDNEDMYPTGRHITTGNCPLHGA